MNSRLATRRAPAAALVVLSAALLGGCGDGPAEDRSAYPASSEPPSTSPSTSPSPSVSTSESAPTPTVAPASGPAMQIKGVALHLPVGWEVSVPGDHSEGGYDPGGSGGTATMVGGLIVPGETVEGNAEYALKTAKRDGLNAARLDNRTVGGVEGWVVTGTSKLIPLQYQFGTVTGGRSVTISLRWISPPPPDVQTIIDSILATVTYPATAS